MEVKMNKEIKGLSGIHVYGTGPETSVSSVLLILTAIRNLLWNA